MKISKVFEFSTLPYDQNRKLRNLGKFSLTSNFGISCNLRIKIEKNKLSLKFKDYIHCKSIFCHNLTFNL